MLLLISVDDGHPLDWKVLELLKKYQLEQYAIFYIAPQNSYTTVMSAQEIKELSESVEIGGHALTHHVLTKMSLPDQIEEMLTGKHILEKITGKKVASFAPPRGWYNEEVTNNVKACGFSSMRTMKQGITCIERNSFVIPVTVHFHPNHYETWENLLPESINSDAADVEGLLSITCHGWELEKFQLWDEFEKMLTKIGTYKDYAHSLSRS